MSTYSGASLAVLLSVLSDDQDHHFDVSSVSVFGEAISKLLAVPQSKTEQPRPPAGLM